MSLNCVQILTMKEQLYSQWEEQGMPEEQMEMAWNMTSNFMGPIPMFFISVIGGVIFGAIIGLIMGAILKRERPYA